MTRSAKKLLSYGIKAGILLLTIVFIYRQYLEKGENLKRFQTLITHINHTHVVITMIVVVVLMLLNWITEALKWQYVTRELEPMSIWQAIEAVFCGLTWAIFTPNRLGEYAGRVLFLPNRIRIHGVFAMAVGSFAQNVITNVLGLSGTIWFIYSFYHMNIWLFLWLAVSLVIFMVFLLVFYFHIKWLVWLLDYIPYIKKFHKFFEIMGRYKITELLNIMWFSLTRFAVFSFQYYLLIHLLIPEMPVVEMMLLVFVLFFIQSAIPSLDFLDVGVRNLTASFLFGYITDQTLAVMAAVSSIWLINLIIPAILGSVFVFKIHFFDRNV